MPYPQKSRLLPRRGFVRNLTKYEILYAQNLPFVKHVVFDVGYTGSLAVFKGGIIYLFGQRILCQKILIMFVSQQKVCYTWKYRKHQYHRY